MTFWPRLAWLLDGAWFRRRRWYLWFSAGAAVILTLCLLSPLLGARWSLIDDHELVRIYDASSSHGPSWFLHSLLQSEVGSPGSSSRYRPVYYFFRIAETGLWHGSARFWWWSHTAIFAGSITLFLAALRRVTGLWENLAIAIWTVGALPWWGDIFCRLGPSETYCVPALALYAWGLGSAIRTLRSGKLPRYHRWVGAALAIGGVVAAGSKENMVFLLLPSMYIAARARWRGSRRWLTIGCAAHVAFGLFVAVATYVGVKNVGHVYAEDTANGRRLDLMVAALHGIWSAYYPWILAAVAVAAAAIAKTRRRELARSVARTTVYVAFVILVYVSQVAFYNGWPPKAPRYFFPGALCGPLVIYLCYVGAIRALRIATSDVRPVLVIRVAALLFVTWQLFHLHYETRAAARTMHDSSIEISKKLRRVVKAAHDNPDAPVVIVANSVWDYEPIHAVEVFLKHGHVTNPVYLLNRFTSAQFAEKSLERQLAQALESVAGGSSYGSESFSLTRRYAYAGGPCVGVGLSGETGLESCPAVAIF